MAFERRQPSVDLRAFLDPLKPGDYFDCGEARLYGIDEALEEEALRRGRAVGDDQFQLVATDGGLIFCRASIMFAIAARWKDLTIGRPQEGNRPGQAVVPINWPTHGNLQFTVSRRLGSNVFRRWLQLQAQATRRSQVEQDARFERSASVPSAPINGHSPLPDGNGGPADGPAGDDHHEPGRQPVSSSGRIGAAGEQQPIDLRRVEPADGGGVADLEAGNDLAGGAPSPTGSLGMNEPHPNGVTLQLDDSDREAIRYATRREQGRNRRFRNGATSPVADGGTQEAAVDPLATLDAAVVDEWVDDRVPGRARTAPRRDMPRPGEGEPTIDPFTAGSSTTEPPSADRGTRRSRPPAATGDDAPGRAVRFEARTTGDTDATGHSEVADHADVGDDDAMATQFMARTVDGTEIFPGRGDGSGPRSQPGERVAAVDDDPDRSPPLMPVPEIKSARLQHAEPEESVVGPRLDIRSTLLAGRQDSDWVELLRQRQVVILAVVTVLALVAIAFIGYVSADDGDAGTNLDTGAVADPAAADQGDVGGATNDPGSASGAAGDDAGISTPSTTIGSEASGDAETVVGQSTVQTLRVSSTSVQICHSNYGGCVPVAADVDCEGDGDGPAFQVAPVAVFGEDVYGLDTDQDREACEPDQPRATATGDG